MTGVKGITGLRGGEAEIIDLKLENGWAMQVGNVPLQAHRIGGLVFVQGILTGAAGTTNRAFRLPAGWRPALSVFNALIYYNGSSWVAGNFVVNADGVPGRCALYNAANAVDTVSGMTNCGINITFKATA